MVKRKQPVALSRPSAPNSGQGSQPVPPSAPAVPFAPSLSRAEVFSCLREVNSYWSTPQISPREVEELERQNLIQRAPAGLGAIRLTSEGARVKQGRPREMCKDA